MPLLVIFVIFLEFVVFRFILPASDMPYRYSIESSGDVVRFNYKDYGMYKKEVYRKSFLHNIKANYNINKTGWNSNKEYYEEKSKERIAIIGDSYVEALQVDSDKSLAERGYGKGTC